MEIKELITTRNFTKGNNKKNKFLVIHYVGAVSTALNNAKYFNKEYRGASAHYFVDENDIYRVVKEEDVAWHCGTNGKYYSDCRNSNSLGIEMCCYMNNGVLDVSEKVVNRTVELTKELMKKYNIPAERVIRHYDVTRKTCPAPFVNNVARWNDFKARLVEAPKENPINNTVNNTTSRKVGDVVTINGVYTSSTSTKKLNPVVKTGTITKIVANARNPYLLNNGNIGWVNDGCIVSAQAKPVAKPVVNNTAIKVGNKVKVKQGAKSYKGVSLASFVYNTVYDVIEVKGNRAVIGKGNVVTTDINIKDLYNV